MAGFDADVGIYPQANPNALTQSAGQYLGLANEGQQNQLLQTANQQTHQDLIKQQVGYLTNGFGALLSKPDLSPEDFLSFGQRALQEGIISPQTYQAEAANVQAAGNDPVKLRGLAQQYIARASDAAQQFALATGYTPAAGGSPVQYTGPTGATVTTTQANFAGANGVNPLMAQPPASSPNALAQQAPGSGTPAKPSAPVPLAPQKSNAGAAGGIAGPTPQQQAQFTASAQQQQEDLTSDANYTSNIVPIQKVISLLPKTPLFGAGAEVPTQVAKVLNTFGIPIGSDQAKNASELDKYLTQLTRSSGAAPNSDAQLVAAYSANPNMTTDKAAATDVIKTMMALSRMQHAKVAIAQSQGVAPEQYSTFASQWGAGQDPRAYGFDLMDPNAKAALKTELKANPAEAQKFINSYNTAQQAGIFGQAQ